MNDLCKAHIEILEIKSDDEFLRSHEEITPAKFWQAVNQYSYPTLKMAAKKLLCIVGSTYCCEQFYSHR